MVLYFAIVPKSYAYLPEGRALPAVFELLSATTGSHSRIVSTLLKTLTQCSSLPPVNWTGALLNTIRRMPQLCQMCVQCALKLTETSKGFHLFIIYCCSLVFFSSLEVCIIMLLHTILTSVTTVAINSAADNEQVTFCDS